MEGGGGRVGEAGREGVGETGRKGGGGGEAGSEGEGVGGGREGDREFQRRLYIIDPSYIISTSKDPPFRLRQQVTFAKEPHQIC